MLLICRALSRAQADARNYAGETVFMCAVKSQDKTDYPYYYYTLFSKEEPLDDGRLADDDSAERIDLLAQGFLAALAQQDPPRAAAADAMSGNVSKGKGARVRKRDDSAPARRTRSQRR
jgi:hypothetical protein